MSLIRETDLGTPDFSSGETIRLVIDGKPVEVPSGISIMRAAALSGESIPKLCATDTMRAFGSCRVCLVEVEGRAGTPASCTTPVAEGMIVRTRSDRIDRIRRGVMELYLSDHPADCASSPSGGDCELHGVAAAVGLDQVRYAPGANHLDAAIDASNPYFEFDPAKCILCSRCVRACDEIQGTFALTIGGRGFASTVSASQNEPFLASECVSCGACVQACPSIARSPPALIAALAAPSRSR